MRVKTKKRCFSVALAMVLTVSSMLPLPAQAVENQVDGQAETEKILSEEEKAALYAAQGLVTEIITPEQLFAWADFLIDAPSYWDGASIVLKEDIDMAAYCAENDKTWQGLGIRGSALKGSFDGQGHTVILPGDSPALINYAERLTISNVTVKSTGTLVASGNTSAERYAAGLVAFIEEGNIANCSNQAAVSNQTEGGSYTGGIAGYTKNVKISECWNSGAVSGGNGYAGGITGNLTEGQVSNCFNIGTVEGGTAGGIVGQMSIAIGLASCHNANSVTGISAAAGLVGEMDSYGILKDSLNTGVVTAAEGASNAVVNVLSRMLINCDSCYYDSTVCPTASPSGAEGKTTEELVSGNGIGLSIENWSYEGGYYPMLSYFANDTSASAASAAAAKAAAAAAYVPSDGFVSLSAGSWTAGGQSVGFGTGISLPSVLTYTNGDYNKGIALSGTESWSGQYYVVTGVKFDSIKLGVQASLNGTEIEPENNVYTLPYNSQPSLMLKASADGIEDAAFQENLKNMRWIAQIPEGRGLELSQDAAGTQAEITGKISAEPDQSKMRIVVCAGVPDFYYSIYEFGIQIKEGTPEFTVTLPESEQEPVYDGKQVAVQYNLSEQPNLDESQISVIYYRQGTSTEWTVTSPENSGAMAEGKEPVWAGTYKAVVSCAENAYYQNAEKELEYTIRPRDLTEDMLAETDWSVPELLNSAEARKPVIVRETDPDIDGGGILTAGKDYTLFYSGVSEPGTALVTVTGIGNYTGVLEQGYEIQVGSQPVKLKPGNSFTLGEGSWYLKEQPEITYYGVVTFYVPNEGEYIFLPRGR